MWEYMYRYQILMAMIHLRAGNFLESGPLICVSYTWTVCIQHSSVRFYRFKNSCFVLSLASHPDAEGTKIAWHVSWCKLQQRGF